MGLLGAEGSPSTDVSLVFAIFAVIGVALMVAVSRLPIPVVRRFSLMFLLLTVFLLFAVFVPQVLDVAWSMPRCVDIGIW